MSKLQIIKGISFPNIPWYKKENIEETIEYVPKEGDIIIASYPKTGTTWLQCIVIQITSRGESFPIFNEVLERMTEPTVIDTFEGMRMYQSHYPYDVVKRNANSKVLYIYRKPEDTFVSCFYFLEHVLEEKLELDEIFEEFLTGNVGNGSYFKHVSSYLSHKDDDNLLMISYEKLRENPKEGILRIAKFLGEEYYQNLSSDESLMDKIIKNTSFDHMKNNLKLELLHYNPESSSEKSANSIHFFRKGVVGDGNNLLSAEHMKRLREKSAEIMYGTEIHKKWFDE